MKLNPIQNSFEAGVLSPLMLGRSDTQPYSFGLMDALNMRVDARGPVSSRSGTRFGFEFAAPCARIETFQVDLNVYFNMLFTNNLLSIGSSTGEVPAIELVINPHFLQGITGWTEETSGGSSQVIFGDGICTLAAQSGGSRYAAIKQEINLADGEVDYEIVVNTFPVDVYNLTVGTTEGGNDLVDQVVLEGEVRSVFNAAVVGATTVWVELRVNDGREVIIRSVSVPESADELDFVTEWTCDHIDDLYFVQAPGGEAIYILHREIQPHKLIYDVSANTFALELVTFTDPELLDPDWIAPVEWGPTTVGSWPGVGAIFQGRLWLMSTLNEPETMWGSRSGSYEKFFVADPLNPVADDAIMKVPMEHYGQIQWSIGTKNLIVGTTTGEYIISSSDGLLRPGDLQIMKQSAYGSASVQPHQVNDQVLYVSTDRRKIRAMHFELTADNWVSNDLLFLSEHLSLPKIKDIAWSQNPDNLLWCLLADGTLLSCTYERNNNIIGWMPHDTQGRFTDIAVGSLLGEDWISLLAKRQTDLFSFEVMFPSTVERPPMDALERHESVIPFTTVSGLDHLEGMTVQIVADDAVKPDQVVVGGEITLEAEANDVFIGLGFNSMIRTLPLEMGSRTGTGAAHYKRYVNIYVRVLDSIAPMINGVRPPTRNPTTPMNTPEQPRTEDIKVANLGWDKHAIVTIEQDLPKPLTVVSLFGEVAQEDL